MYRKGSILLPVLIVLFVISLLAAGGIFYLYQKEYSQNVKLQEQIVELEDLQRRTTSQLEESKKTAMDLGLKLQEARNRLDSLSVELTAEKTAHAETTNKLEQLKVDLANQKSLREDLENRLNQVQGDSKQIKEQVRIMQQQKVELEAKIKNLESGAGGVELGKVVVNPELLKPVKDAALDQSKIVDKKNNAPDAKVSKVTKNELPGLAKGLEGKVMIVNKEFNFVVINLGSKDRIKVGDEFSVFRSGKPIGDLKVEKVHEAMSAAGFSPELKDLIKENDLVKQKIK
jgi:predicted RNase H-like nuclease (RuvC/YqgF family)